MPNRIIKESICVSDTINALSWFEECLFYRLIVSCDDFGRFDARPAIIKGRLFPLKERLTLKDIKEALNKLAAVGCVLLYEYDEKPYLQLPTWAKHQSPRAKNSKFPSPSTDLHTSANICMQAYADVPDNDNENDKRYSRTEKSASPSRHKHGQYQNVLLSEEEFTKLQSEFPIDYQERIERLSEYIASTGKTYKNHFVTIRSWARKDQASEQDTTGRKMHTELNALENLAIQRMQGGNESVSM